MALATMVGEVQSGLVAKKETIFTTSIETLLKIYCQFGTEDKKRDFLKPLLF
jgi:hypothetical protein